jgi:hypothetical protein
MSTTDCQDCRSVVPHEDCPRQAATSTSTDALTAEIARLREALRRIVDTVPGLHPDTAAGHAVTVAQMALR